VHNASEPQPTQKTMLALLTSFWISQLLFVMAKLGVADVLIDGPLSVEAIAEKVGAAPSFLRRALRALASVDVFAEGSSGRFRLTPLAQTLRGDHPESLRAFALMIAADYNWKAWGALEQSVTAGANAFEQANGAPFFKYLEQHPQEDLIFSASMASLSAMENAAIAKAYRYGKLKRLVDVGGAHGHLLATILQRHLKLHGVLYDQPQVIEQARVDSYLNMPTIRARCTATGGDFFESVPAGADAYIMKYILHDWDDEQCVRLLSNCRHAMTAEGRVLAVEYVIATGNRADWAKLVDVNMMVTLGGRERTKQEFHDLFARAGLTLKRVIPTESPLSILEAVRI
jgi:O-methyltransferase domain/Dimerisation domain